MQSSNPGGKKSSEGTLSRSPPGGGPGWGCAELLPEELLGLQQGLSPPLLSLLCPQSTQRTSGMGRTRSSGRVSRRGSWTCWRTSEGSGAESLPRGTWHLLQLLLPPPASAAPPRSCFCETASALGSELLKMGPEGFSSCCLPAAGVGLQAGSWHEGSSRLPFSGWFIFPSSQAAVISVRHRGVGVRGGGSSLESSGGCVQVTAG